ncbi:hypothetical protein [Gordonia jinghuaiqii]|uniref:hypothetical protein n=1 Tax=Gordonia jinghuaiqii TaxID=2758710 RepID=UPI001FD4E36F|nr:hypothetical protein [Gordonia jinghuaiqii]
MADRTVDDRMRMRMAVLRTGPDAALAGGAAAWWHGLVPKAPGVPVVVAPHGRNGTLVEGAKVWHRTVDPRDLTEVDGLSVTALDLTVLDASVELGVKVMDNALLNKTVTISTLDTVQRRNAGRRGSPRARAMLGRCRRERLARPAVHLAGRHHPPGVGAGTDPDGRTSEIRSVNAEIARCSDPGHR